MLTLELLKQANSMCLISIASCLLRLNLSEQKRIVSMLGLVVQNPQIAHPWSMGLAKQFIIKELLKWHNVLSG